jgi:ribosomal protein L31
MTGIHPTHSVVVTCAGNSECSKCWSCVCHENTTLTRPCTKGEG